MEYNNKIQKVLDFLQANGISYEIYTHPSLFTIEEALEYWSKIDAAHVDGTGPMHCKNLFVRNHKGNRHYLISYECHKHFDMHAFEHVMHQGKMSFASPERMDRCLGVQPGSVCLFGLINDMNLTDADPKELFENGHRVKFFFDEDLLKAPAVSFHPCDNTATVVITQDGFRRFLEIWGGEYQAISISAE